MRLQIFLRIQVHLPHFLTKQMVYHIMEEELKPEGIEIVSLSHFYALWNEHFRNTVIPKVTPTSTKLMTSPL